MARQKHKKRSATPAVHSDIGTPERWKKGPIRIDRVVEEGVTNRDVAIAEHSDDPLFRRKRSGAISRAQYEAGIAFRMLGDKAIKRPGITSGYTEKVATGNVELMMIRSEQHYQRYIAAIRAVGPVHSQVVLSVAIHQEDIARNAVQGLRDGLDRLIKHFGMQDI